MSDGTFNPEHETVCECPSCIKMKEQCAQMKALVEKLFMELDTKNNQVQALVQQLYIESLEVRGERLRRTRKRPELVLSACASASIA